MLPSEKCLSRATQGDTVPGGSSVLDFGDLEVYVQHRAARGFCGSEDTVAHAVHPQVSRECRFGWEGIVIHLPVVRTGPSLLAASFKPSLPPLLPRELTSRGGRGEEDFQVKVGALRWSELSKVIAFWRHVTPGLLCKQLSVNPSCFSWSSGEWHGIL